jgi:membrane protease YdiL (CAAX protease family)
MVAILLGWLLNTPPLESIRASWPAAIEGIVATVPLLIAMWGCSKSSFGPIKDLMRQVEIQIVPLFEGAPFHALLLISLFAGIGEECLFRGVMQPGLSAWVGVPIALTLTSGIFGLAHLITPTYAVFAGLIGAYLGVIAVATDNLFVPIVTHALYDLAALKYLVSAKRKRVQC